VLDPNTTLAIILGVSECPRAPNLQPLPQCANSAADFDDYLRRTLDLPASNVINLFDSKLPAGEQLEQIEDWLLHTASGRTRPTDLIVFYTGHGGFTRIDQAYFLAVQRTRAGSEGATSIRYIDLASSIKRHADALRKYLILDCCFAASAVMRIQADLSQMVVQRVQDGLPSSGTAVLCSSAAKFVSLAPEGERYTMFSGALLQCLRNGIVGATRALTLEEIGKRTREIILKKFPNDAVRPELHVPDQHKGNPALAPMFPNANWTPPAPIAPLAPVSDGATITEPISGTGSEESAGVFGKVLQFLAKLMFHLFVCLGGTALIFIIGLTIRQMQFHDASVEQRWHLTLAFLVFLSTAFFVTLWREMRLAAGKWRYESGAILRCTVLCTIAIGFVSALVTFAVHQGGSGRFYAMLIVGFGMALPSALLFQLLMRWAARSPPTNAAVAARVGYEAKLSELIRTTVYAGALYFMVAIVAVFGLLYWPSDYLIVTSTPQQIVDAAINSIENVGAAYWTAEEDDKWFIDVAAPSAIRDLQKSLHDAKLDLSSSNFRPGTIPSILAACDALGDFGSGKHLFKPGCELGEYLYEIPFKGHVLPNIYKLQGQISMLKRFDALQALQNYATLATAVEHEWRNAVLASSMWAVMAAVFAVSVLLYRRQELWDGFTLKNLPDFAPEKQQERDAWLRQPLYDMGKLSPLEALHYPVFKARLALHMNA